MPEEFRFESVKRVVPATNDWNDVDRWEVKHSREPHRLRYKHVRCEYCVLADLIDAGVGAASASSTPPVGRTAWGIESRAAEGPL
jgi:hypothetical protein